MTYVGDSGTGPIGDMRFEAVGLTGNVYPAKTEGCGEPDGRLGGGQLEIGQAIEGWVCWPVANEEESMVIMAVGAEPANGVLYMSLEADNG